MSPTEADDLLRELVFSSQLRPRLSAALVERFRRKVQRTSLGYAPRDGDELRDFVSERIAIPEDEWRELLDAVEKGDGDLPMAELVGGLEDRVVVVGLPRASESWIAALERLPRISRPQMAVVIAATSGISTPCQRRK